MDKHKLSKDLSAAPRQPPGIREERLREFQEAYKQDFDSDISPEEAREMLFRLVTLYDLLRRPFPGEDETEEFTQFVDTP